MAADRSVARLSRPRRHAHQHGGRTTARSRRRDPRRAHHRQRIRRTERERDEAERRHPQSVAPRTNDGRVVGRQRGGRGRRTRSDRDRRRRRRLDSHPRGLHRPARHEGHLRPDPARSGCLLPSRHRRARLSRPIGARRGSLLRRVRRIRLARPVEPPRATRLGSGPRRERAPGSTRAIVPALGGGTLEPGVEEQLRASAANSSSTPE